MEKDNLGSKKINNKQDLSQELNPENVSDATAQKLTEEIEIDSHGNEKIVHRARNTDVDKEHTTLNSAENQLEEQTPKMIENKDHNSDITANRYPNSHPDNRQDRGNMKLDK